MSQPILLGILMKHHVHTLKSTLKNKDTSLLTLLRRRYSVLLAKLYLVTLVNLFDRSAHRSLLIL